MEVTGACRCCLTEGLHKDLKSPYVFLDRKEVYFDMLQECFNIFLMPLEHSSNVICDVCIKTLRNSWTFKQQVIKSEETLLQCKVTSDSECKPEMEVKTEPKYESDDSDNYLLADAVREMTVERVKVEQKKTKMKKKKKEESWKNDDVTSLVSQLSSIGCDIKPVAKRSKKITLTIGNKTPHIIWDSNSTTHKNKQTHNLLTILKYTNATPFKSKSLLGFICYYCENAYPDPENLRQHTLEEHKKERLECNISDVNYFYVNLDVTDLNCTLCDQNFDSLNTVKSHLVNVHKKVIHNDIKDMLFQFKLKAGNVYDCAICTSTYETFKMLRQHMNIHYSNYQCKLCESAFATKRSLSSHKTTHQNGNFKCDRCDKVFASLSKKQYHMKTHLGKRNISNCPFCDQPFRSYYQRNQHLVQVHNTEAQYKCNVCTRSFLLKSLLMSHIKKNHLMERNAQCTECGYRFFSKKALKAHMVKHTGERNYACEVCHKTYARKFTLREHMRIHNNDRRFKCHVCGMSFVQKCSLKSHLLSNHGISMAASEINSTCTKE